MEQKQPEKRKHGKRYVLVGGVLVMLLVCYLLGVATGKRGGDVRPAEPPTALAPTSTTVALEILEPSETPEPTETAEPTMTPEPTWTSTLTATPHPTLTATPVPTATAVTKAEALPTLTFWGWDQETFPQIEILVDAGETLQRLLRDPMFDDATWKALFAAQVVRIREADAALREIVPPEECREAHAMLVSSTGDKVLAVEYHLKGIQQEDRDLFNQGSEYLASSTSKFNLFALMVKAMTP